MEIGKSDDCQIESYKHPMDLKGFWSSALESLFLFMAYI